MVSFSGLSYATLASIFPENGGGYLFARRMLGNYPGFLTGWAMYVSTLISISFVLLGFGIYYNLLLGINLDPRFGAIAAVLLLTALNLRGLSEAGKFEVALVVTKVAILILIAIAGLIHVQRTDFVPFMPNGAGGVIEGITMVFFAYMGFQVVSMMGGEFKESSKTVPAATLVSIGIVAAIYRCGYCAHFCKTAFLRSKKRVLCLCFTTRYVWELYSGTCSDDIYTVVSKCQYNRRIEDHTGDGKRKTDSRQVYQG